MKHPLFILVLFGLVYNLSFAKTSNSNDLLLLNRLKQYELDAHDNFQKELYEVSDDYIKAQSEAFVDEETGFFSLWSEAFHYFESDVKKRARWKSRVEKYFRSTEYSMHINEKQAAYTNTINTQREELLEKLHVANHTLSIASTSIPTINTSDETITKVVESTNKLVLTEVIPEVIESIVLPLFLWFIGYLVANLLLINFSGAWIKRILFVVLMGFSIYKSIRYSNELEDQVYHSFELANKEHLDIQALLTDNTTTYYSELTLKIKE